MTRYTISCPEEESQCEQCGFPIFIGDRAVESDTGRIACSVDHARALDARRKEACS